jgi:hypothetical protein
VNEESELEVQAEQVQAKQVQAEDTNSESEQGKPGASHYHAWLLFLNLISLC